MLRDSYGPHVRDGFLTEHNILAREAVNGLMDGERISPNDAILGQLAINLELWARDIIQGERVEPVHL